MSINGQGFGNEINLARRDEQSAYQSTKIDDEFVANVHGKKSRLVFRNLNNIAYAIAVGHISPLVRANGVTCEGG